MTKKEQKLTANLEATVRELIGGKRFKSMTEAEMLRKLGQQQGHLLHFRKTLSLLVKEGLLQLEQGRYSQGKIPEKGLVGPIALHPRGFGFFQAKGGDEVFIPRHLTNGAVDGDTVEVVINEASVSEKGPEGKVVRIVSRGRTHLAGTVISVSRNGTALLFAPILGPEQQVRVDKTTCAPGDRIVVEVLEWGDKESPTLATFSRKIGSIDDPSVDIEAAIAEFEIRSEFPKKAVEEAESHGTSVSPAEIKKRQDLRDEVTLTIDPDTAKDFDDAISLTKSPNGHYNLGVHIADVAHYVSPGTLLDTEASLRSNSTYFPGKCVPMLPPVLSDNLCSLKPNVNRLTISVMMQFDPEGNMTGYQTARSVINSAKRFTYKEAKQVLDGSVKSPHKALLELMTELCTLLKKKRYERGSLEFALPELVIKVDESGDPFGTDLIQYDVTHQMIEEFMLKANETVATHLSSIGQDLTYRIHDEPSEENMRDFSDLVRAFGFRIPEMPKPGDLQRLFDEAAASPYLQHLAVSYIRRMRLAVYSADNIGHYGLGLTHYCHFTSPIRRYVDLVVHRILMGELHEYEHLQEIAKRCSDRERVSAKAEMSVVQLKKLRLLKKWMAEDNQRQFEAVITRVKPFGVTFEIGELSLESFLHISKIGNDYYEYDEITGHLRGESTGEVWALGDSATVMVKQIDLIQAEAEFHMVQHGNRRDQTRTERKKSAPRGRTGKKRMGRRAS